MKDIEGAALVAWPDMEIIENFYFEAVSPWGTFVFRFRWLEGRWRGWVTTPDGEVRQIGIYPGALSGTGYLDFGFDMITDLAEIGYSDLFKTELYILKWQ